MRQGALRYCGDFAMEDPGCAKAGESAGTSSRTMPRASRGERFSRGSGDDARLAGVCKPSIRSNDSWRWTMQASVGVSLIPPSLRAPEARDSAEAGDGAVLLH